MPAKAPPKRYGAEFDLTTAIDSLGDSYVRESLTNIFTRVTSSSTQALWYGWGRLDGDPGQDPRIDALKFSRFYAEDRFLFITDQIGMGMSMQSAWDAYVKEITNG